MQEIVCRKDDKRICAQCHERDRPCHGRKYLKRL